MQRSTYHVPDKAVDIDSVDVYGITFTELVMCRGSDMKLRPHAKALLTLGPGMCRDKLVQAAMRMRQLEQSQSLILVATSEVSRCAAVQADITET
jgi:hypothetical protein